jgi:TetR/AcrR family transcriptional repressor of nem operon
MTSLPTATADSRTRLLDAALAIIRRKGYNATTVDDLCAATGLSKGSFFHHFKGKEDLALAAARHWSRTTGALFETAPYQQVADPRERLLAYIDLRAALAQGELPDISCLLGTMVQETYVTHPAIRDACRDGIEAHAQTLVPTIAEARAKYAPRAAWTPESLALFTQAALQGAFVVAKAADDAQAAAPLIAHLRAYVQGLLPLQPPAPRPRRRVKP